MFKHILKNIWTSRKSNVWILLELFVVSIFLWFSIDYIYINVRNLSRPLGFDYQEVYRVGLGKLSVESDRYDPAPEHTQNVMEDFLSVLQRIKEHPLVEEVCCTYSYPVYVWSNWEASIKYDTLSVGAYRRQVTPSYFDVFRVKTYTGRSPAEFFGKNSTLEAIVTEDVAEELFGSGRPLGIKIAEANVQDSLTLVDVCEKQKMMDYYGYQKAIYFPMIFNPEDRMHLQSTPEIYFRVKDGADHKDLAYDFRKEMSSRLEIGNFYLQQIEPVSDQREYVVRESRNSFNLFISVILFFLVNIFLGVLGTFWFRTQYRRHEIGLRLALGSTRNQIRALLIVEGLVLLIIAFIPALFICYRMQDSDFVFAYPIPLSTGRFVIVQSFTLLTLMGMLILGIWFPARRAMNTEPAEVLHEE